MEFMSKQIGTRSVGLALQNRLAKPVHIATDTKVPGLTLTS